MTVFEASFLERESSSDSYLKVDGLPLIRIIVVHNAEDDEIEGTVSFLGYHIPAYVKTTDYDNLVNVLTDAFRERNPGRINDVFEHNLFILEVAHIVQKLAEFLKIYQKDKAARERISRRFFDTYMAISPAMTAKRYRIARNARKFFKGSEIVPRRHWRLVNSSGIEMELLGQRRGRGYV